MAGEAERRRPVVVFPAAHQRGGVERAVWEALRTFAARGPVVFVGVAIEPPIAGVEQWQVPQRHGALAPLRFRRAAERALRSRRPDDVVVSFGANCPTGDVVVVNSVHRTWLRRGRPARVRGREVPNVIRYLLARHLVLLGLERRYYAQARDRRVVVVADQVARDLADGFAVPLERCTTIHNGFAPEQCSPTRRCQERGAMRRRWQIPDGTVALLFAANELHRKGFDCLLEAVARLGRDDVDVHVVGRAGLDDHRVRISELGLEGRVHHHGSVDVGLAHAAADVLVLPTQYEAFALTIVEALASGLPVITTAAPGAGDLIEHDVTGLLQQDPADADELADLLRRVLDPAARDRFATAAPRAVAGLEWSTLMARLDDVVQAAR
jgi:UDP-glucose:(heptosyl)LPS alpha-1,3-glucosyltransferase